MMRRAFLYSLPIFAFFAQIAVAHDSLVPHSHPHGYSLLLGTGDLIVLALASLAAMLLFKPAKKVAIRVLMRRRK
ncbi:MAG: hypothetical protein KTR19_07475 [Hyphomicrobiales bacterium]|nr:hypothetical protein [Hyphomicrobiales bacterium]